MRGSLGDDKVEDTKDEGRPVVDEEVVWILLGEKVGVSSCSLGTFSAGFNQSVIGMERYLMPGSRVGKRTERLLTGLGEWNSDRLFWRWVVESREEGARVS